jgi:hypothetical protein
MNLLDTVDQQVDERAELELKWKDKPLEELLKAKVDSDIYIKTLERQKDELRTDYLKQRDELLAKAKFEELVDRLQNPDRQVTPPIVNDTEKPQYDPKEMEALILSKINESKSMDVQTANFKLVETKLRERYGDNFASILKDQQNTLRLSDDDINNLAKKSPEAFFRMMGLDNQKTEGFQTPPRSNQRADSFAPRQVKRDWNYYQELKKTNPRLYLDPKIAVQMHNDAIELGEAFGL